jgi:hypothetical protein
VTRKYAFNPSKIRFHPETSSLLIILLEVWSVARKYAFNPPKIRFYPEISNYPPLPSVSKKHFSQRCAAAPPQSISSFILPDPAAHRPRMWLRPLAGKRLSRAPPGARLHLLARSIPCPSISGQRPGQLRMSPRPARQSPCVFCLPSTTPPHIHRTWLLSLHPALAAARCPLHPEDLPESHGSPASLRSCGSSSLPCTRAWCSGRGWGVEGNKRARDPRLDAACTHP